MKPKDYGNNEERRLWEKRWETIKPIFEYRKMLRQLPIQKFIRGIVIDPYEVENTLEFLRLEKCFKQFRILGSGVVEFIGVNQRKIIESFSHLERIYKRYSQKHKLKQLTISNKNLPKIHLQTVGNKASLLLDGKFIQNFRITSQPYELLRTFERLGNGNTTKVDGLYELVIKKGHANSFDEKVEALREVCGEIQRKLSIKGLATNLNKVQETKTVRFEISPKLGKQR